MRAAAAATQTLAVLSEMLWVSGLVLAHMVCTKHWVHRDPSQGGDDWVSYLVLGTVFPTIVLMLSLLWHKPWVPSLLLRGFKLFLSAFFAVFSIRYLAQHTTAAILWISLGQALLLLFTLAFRSQGLSIQSLRQVLKPDAIALGLAGTMTVVLAWTIVGGIIYWQRFDEMITSSLYSVGVFSLALALASLTVFPCRNLQSKGRFAFLSVSNLAAALVIVPFAFNTVPMLSGQYSFWHWAWVVGPAQLVREGGWLLWDVYATYGFLSMLAIALFPTQSTWQSLYVLNSLLLCLSSLLIFLLLRAVGRGVSNFLTALLVAVSAVFLMPGHAGILTGVQLYPTVGAFRFFWCFALLGVLVWNYCQPGMKNRLRKVACTGGLVWLLGSLWSPESAAYCTAIWIPAYVLIVWERFAARDADAAGGRVRAVSDAAPWLLIPPLLMIGAVGIISIYYLVKLGHLPDFTAFVEVVLAFTFAGIHPKPIDPAGNVWVLVLVFCAVSTVAAHVLGHGRRLLLSLSVISGIWGAIWATASYLVYHYEETQALNLAPLYCASIAILLIVFSRCTSQEPVLTLVKIALVPVLTLVVFSTFGNELHLGTYLKRSYTRYTENSELVLEVDQLIPFEDREMHDLLDRAGVKPGDPITTLNWNLLGRVAYLGDDGLRHVRSEHTALLPIKPAWALTMLRRREYRTRQFISRWISRSELSGWLLVPKRNPHLLWVVNMMKKTHVPTKVFSSARWELIRMELKREMSS